MKTLLIVLLSASLMAFSLLRTPDFQEQLLSAETYCFSIAPEADSIANIYGLHETDILPVVYPECARYSSLSDQLESNMLEFYYIEGGTTAADFSVGRFQMKPSFAEEIERLIATEPYLESFRQYFSYQQTGLKQQREERLNRLLNVQWQLHYLCCFYRIMESRTENHFATAEERLAFIAAAYNYGFNRSEEHIHEWRNTTAFPNGISGSGNYNYADLAISLKRKMTSYENN